jgi:hypothetical protein
VNDMDQDPINMARSATPFPQAVVTVPGWL